MDEDDGSYNVVDPEVRAYIYSLVSALGGTGTNEDGRYVLGDEALACLKDIKRWLKLHDEKANRLDVARCLAEANLVNGDLLRILAIWPEEATEDKIKSKIALACLELLVPLTWPIEKNDLQMTVNHHRHVPYLQLAQLSYKRGILDQEVSATLRTAVRIGLPSIALPISERESRDEGIIKLLLYFFRNVALICPPQHLPIQGDENDISRSATIEAFHRQDVLALLLTISSNMGEDFNTQDVVVMEVLFHLLKGVDVEKLFMNEERLNASTTDELKGLLAKEAGMHKNYAKNAPTRHNRFGTMIWIKRDDDKMSTVTGQDVLTNTQHTLSKMDQSKKWNRPRQRGKGTASLQDQFDLSISLSANANKNLRTFVEEFLDSGFNPLFNHVRRAIEREAERVLEVHSQQFFFLVSWFLAAERVRRRNTKEAHERKRQDDLFEPDSFALIASVLNQETFITLNRYMQDRFDMKAWQEVNAGMRCFTQILLTVQEMSESPLEEDQEIAENIQNRIFYEESTHDRVVAIVRSYKDQGFGYLDACTELSHVFLRMLERYSKENVQLQIRSRRRARRKKITIKSGHDISRNVENEESEAEDVAEAQRASKERKFDFTRFSAKFITQKCIDTFICFLKYFNDLKREQLKRAHRFLYRVAFKHEMSIMLFRVDIMALLNKVVKGPHGLDTANPTYKEWEELVRQLIRRMTKKFQERPELAVEMLFSKINSTVFYLQYGYENLSTSFTPRAPAELEVKDAMARDNQLSVAVSVLHNRGKTDAVDWVNTILTSASDERKSWEAANAAGILEDDVSDVTPDSLGQPPRAPPIIVKPDSEERGLAMFKDNKLRLLMRIAGFERLGVDDEPNATWIIPSSLPASHLKETQETIERYRNDPVNRWGEELELSAEDMLRRKVVQKAKRVEYDDDSGDHGIVSDGGEDFRFPAGGPTNKKVDALRRLKSKRRKRQPDDVKDESPLDEESRRAARKARDEAHLEKMRKIKSDLYVHDSDEEDNEERDKAFFTREEQIRKGQSARVLKALQTGVLDDVAVKRSTAANKKTRKRKAGIDDTQGGEKRPRTLKHSLHDLDITQEASESDTIDAEVSQESSPVLCITGLESSQEETSGTPLSSPHLEDRQISTRESVYVHGILDASSERMLGARKPLTPMNAAAGEMADSKRFLDGEPDRDGSWPILKGPRRRARGILISDSDTE